MPQSALIVDDDRTERKMVAGVLRARLNLDIFEAGSGQECLENLKENAALIRLAVLDLDMPGMSGLETLAAISKKHPRLPVIVLTGSTNMDDAVQAIKMGASDFLSKPANAERITVSVRNALRISIMANEITRLKRRSENTPVFADLIGHDGGLSSSVKTGRKAAICNLPVLVTGETGTGKEVFARALHGESERAGAPFIAINCGAIPEKLVESALFGHEKGAFTGAVTKAIGKFQEADGGTIFLDEAGELPLEAQVKLLRVLQQHEIEPVGSGRAVPVNVRVISATNRDLAKEVQEGRFRQDLYFRLNVLHIPLPALRYRQSDIPDLVRHFISLFCTSHEIPLKNLTPQALAKLQEHNWPGNVRELENVAHRAITVGEKEDLDEDDFFPFGPAMSEEPAGHRNAILPVGPDGVLKPLNILEQEIIRIALAHHGNNISQAARALGLAKSTLYTKIGRMADKPSR